jgi:hypothetical protein
VREARSFTAGHKQSYDFEIEVPSSEKLAEHNVAGRRLAWKVIATFDNDGSDVVAVRPITLGAER